MQSSNIFEALASPPSKENQDPKTENAQPAFSFKGQAENAPLGDITNKTVEWQDLSTDNIKPVSKPAIIENPSSGPALDWEEQSTQKNMINIQVTPVVEEKAHKYETQFPALGEEPQPESLEPDVEFDKDILSPANIVVAQALHGSTTDTIQMESLDPVKASALETKVEPTIESKPHETSAEYQIGEHKAVIIESSSIAPAKNWEELVQPETTITSAPINEEKVQVYEAHFPALGEEAVDQPETKFTPEILASEPVVAQTLPLANLEAQKRPSASKNFDQLLETEIEQLDQANLNKASIEDQKYRGKEQRQKQEKELMRGASDLEPIEEHIEIQDETDNFKQSAKQGAKRSSLDYISEEHVMNQSTELTLSAHRIDLIKEELREIEHRVIERDPLFLSVEDDLEVVKGLEKNHSYADAIRVLRKSLETLDARFINYSDFDLNEMNKLLYECNIQLAYCYNQIHEIRYTIDHARAARQFNPESIKAIYLLGGALIKAGNFVEGYNVLKEIRRFPLLPTGDVYQDLVDIELKKYERRAQEVLKLEEEGTIYIRKETSPIAGVGCFLGTALTSGALSWFLLKNSFSLSENKSLAYSIGAGTLIGGLSLLLMGHANAK